MKRISVAPAVAGVLLATLTGLIGAISLVPAPAQAAEIYKYWSYFTVADGKFEYAAKGPGETKPADGTIEAYRYAAPADFNNPNLPRADLSTLTFDAICGETSAQAGEKRVAVIVDFGVEQDAVDGQATPEPKAACAVAPEDATGIQVLETAVDDVRVEESSSGAAVCGIQGYPATGCFDNMTDVGTPADGEPVDFEITGADTASDESDDSGNNSGNDSGNSAPLLVGLGVVLVLLVAGGLLLQRRRTQV